MNAPARREGRPSLTVALLIVTFVAPVIAAWVLYLTADRWGLAGRAAHGTLVQPPRPLGEFSLRAPGGAPVTAATLRGRWWIVYVGGPDCDGICGESLYKVRQVRLALGTDMRRVGRLYIMDGERPAASLRALLPHHPGLVLAGGPPEAVAPLLERFRIEGRDPRRAGRLYVVDPRGMLILMYEPGAEPNGILKDLQRLLRASRIG